jgi:hypothetical protein
MLALVLLCSSSFAAPDNHIWTLRADSSVILSVACDSTGRIAAVGAYYSNKSLIYQSNGQSAALMPLNGSVGSFVSVFASDGSYIWSARLNGDNQEVIITSVAFDQSGRVALAGNYQS